MCKLVQCPTCDRPTYAGCGNHVEQVLGHVAPADRCQGHQAPSRASARPGKRTLLGRLTGRES